MNGMQMMLKSMGIDPEQIMQAIQSIQALAQSIDTRLSSIERRLAAMEQDHTRPAPGSDNEPTLFNGDTN